MNLCLVCREARAGVHSGLGRSMGDLAGALGEAGHSVHLLTEASDLTLQLPGVNVTQVPVPPAPALCAGYPPRTAQLYLMHAAAVYREVRRIHEHEQPVDVVLAPLWASEGVVCSLDGRFPTLVTCTTSLRTMTEIDSTMHRLPDIVEQLALEREALRRSRYLHGLTEAVLAKTINDFGLNPDGTAVIGRGLRDRRGPEQQPARENGEVRVLFIGRLEHRKGVDVLLAAARELLADAAGGITFTLAGPDADPAVRGSVEQAVSEVRELDGRLRMTGAVSDEELERLYRDCDVVCAPSRHESHGVVLIEAMMFGKPIVTCDAGGISEVVQAGHNALVVAPNDAVALAAALKRLGADGELRAEFGAAGRQAYERRFEVGAVAERTRTALERISATHSGVAETSPHVAERLEQLLADAFGIGAELAPVIVGELLDPPASAWCAWADTRALARSSAEIGRLHEALNAQEKTLEFLRGRYETLCRIEQGGWWRLRRRVLPLLRLAGRLRALRRT